jgi:integrase
VLEWRNLLIQRASNETWNSYRRDLKSLLNLAVRMGWLPDNPFHDVKPLNGGRRKKTVKKKVLAEAVKLLESDATPIQPGWFWAIAFKLLLFSGMRRRQLAALRWRHLDFTQETILLVTEGSKTRREWEIPMPPQCVADLLELRRRSLEKRRRLDDRQVFWVQLFNRRFAHSELTPEQITRVSSGYRSTSIAVLAPIGCATRWQRNWHKGRILISSHCNTSLDTVM